MAKQTDRLTRVEEIVKGTDATVKKLFDKLDEFITDTQKVRIDCAGKQGKTETHTSIQWWFIAVIMITIIGLAFKR